MFCIRTLILAASGLALVPFAAGAAPASSPLEVGIAFVDITPPAPFRMSGYFIERLSTGTKDPLQARAIVLRQGRVTAALVFCDVIGIPAAISRPVRQKASAETGIPVDHIAVAGTHTHTGPLFFSALHDHLHDEAVAHYGVDPYDSSRFQAELIDKIALAIRQAKAELSPVELSSGTAHEDRLSFNRRFYMKDGSVRFNPPIQSSDIVRPAGPIDPQVGIVLFSKPGASQPSSAIVSFAMHLDTTGGTLFSADYVKSLSDRLSREFGSEFRLLFGVGCCGNINHRDVSRKDQRNADLIGEMLGESVATVIENGELAMGSGPSLAVRSAKLKAPLQPFTKEELADAKVVARRLGSRDLPFLEAVEAVKTLDLARLKRNMEDPVQLEVQVFRLNRETAIVALPNEMFVEFALAIKSQSPFKTTLIMELTNEDLAYTPTREAFVEGSYEIVNSRVVPGTGEKLVQLAVKLLKDLQ